jgi:hypothetical protein
MIKEYILCNKLIGDGPMLIVLNKYLGELEENLVPTTIQVLLDDFQTNHILQLSGMTHKCFLH